MTPPAFIHEEAVELATRTSGGLEVSLLWERTSGRTWVDVVEIVSGERFSVEAPPAQALDVFRHPFAYWAAEYQLHVDRGPELLAETVEPG